MLRNAFMEVILNKTFGKAIFITYFDPSRIA